MALLLRERRYGTGEKWNPEIEKNNKKQENLKKIFKFFKIFLFFCAYVYPNCTLSRSILYSKEKKTRKGENSLAESEGKSVTLDKDARNGRKRGI